MQIKMSLIRQLAVLVDAIEVCEARLEKVEVVELRRHWSEVKAEYEARLGGLASEYLPRGAGFDSGTKVSQASDPDCLVFTTSFHHMNDAGYYTTWSYWKVLVEPDFVNAMTIKVVRQGGKVGGLEGGVEAMKGYIADVFRAALEIEREGW